MSLSMNQQYKAAKTDMPFKDWIEWRKTLETKSDSFFNTDGDTPSAQSVKDKMRKQILVVTIPLLVIGLGMALYGALKEK